MRDGSAPFFGAVGSAEGAAVDLDADHGPASGEAFMFVLFIGGHGPGRAGESLDERAAEAAPGAADDAAELTCAGLRVGADDAAAALC